MGVFPVITGSTGRDRIYDGYPDVALDLVDSRTFDGRIQMLEYIPRSWPDRRSDRRQRQRRRQLRLDSRTLDLVDESDYHGTGPASLKNPAVARLRRAWRGAPRLRRPAPG